MKQDIKNFEEEERLSAATEDKEVSILCEDNNATMAVLVRTSSADSVKQSLITSEFKK